MSDTGQARVREVFFEAFDRPRSERSSYLDEACRGDSALRAAVERLLLADAKASRFLLPHVAGKSADAADRVGTRLGPYALTSVLGLGGMGSVYLAERADEEFHKKVAIKVLRRGLDTEHVLHRFRVEREVLAQLEHPGIARLIDSGTTDDGLPYLVMEYVDGLTLDAFVSKERLTVRERLQLLRDVCDVVNFAHRNLVVHRDLKPSNILIERDGRVRLLDFGISKILDTASLPASLAVTDHEWRAFTPEYASPEQVRGRPVTTASDVYSLGVILYEMLTGKQPYRFETRTKAEVERLVCEVDPVRPSRRFPPRDDGATSPCGPPSDTGGRVISSDLDGIVMKALRKEPERRYGTVVELSDDVRRYLEGFPVGAIGDTWTYRSAKFMRRHRMVLGAGGAVITLLLAFSIVISVQASRIAAEKTHATREAATARRTIELLKQTFQAADPYTAKSATPSDSITVRQMLDAATRRVRFEIVDEPLVRAELLDVIGQVRLSLAQHDVAESLMTEALATRTSILGPRHPDIARSLQGLGHLATERGDYATAARRLDAARDILSEHHGEASVEMAQVERWRGMNALRLGDLDTSEDALDHALSILRRTQNPSHQDLGDVLLARGRLARERGDYAMALELSREGLSHMEAAHGPEHLTLATAIEQIALMVEESKHDYRAAFELKRRAHDIRRKHLGDAHPDVALSLFNLGYSRYLMAELDSARARLIAADDLMKVALGPEHAYRSWTLGTLGLVDGAAGRFGQSIGRFRDAIRIATGSIGPRHRISGTLWVSLGTSEWGAGRVRDAERDMRYGLGILEESPDNRTLVWGTTTIAAFLAARGKRPEADSLFANILPRAEELSKDAEIWFYRAGFQACCGNRVGAMECLRRSIEAGGTMPGAEYFPAFASLREDADFRSAIVRARR